MTEKVKQHAAPVTGSDEIDIGRLVGTVIEARWWVIGITAVFALCAVVYTFFATPIYSADALVQIEQNSGNSLVQDIGSALANKPPASDAEIQLIRSRLVLGKTVDDSRPRYCGEQKHVPDFRCGLGLPDGTSERDGESDHL